MTTTARTSTKTAPPGGEVGGAPAQVGEERRYAKFREPLFYSGLQ